MDTIAKNPRWLEAQVPFAELGDKVRAHPSPSPATRSFSKSVIVAAGVSRLNNFDDRNLSELCSVYSFSAQQSFPQEISVGGTSAAPTKRGNRPNRATKKKCTSVAPSRMNIAIWKNGGMAIV